MKTAPVPPVQGESNDYELELDLSLRQRFVQFLRTWRGMLLVFLLAAVGLGLWQGSTLYHAAKEWRMHALLQKAERAQAAGNDNEAFNALRSAYVLVPGHLDVFRAIARYHGKKGEPAALQSWQQIAESKNATLDDEVALCREALRWGVLDAIRGRLNSWASRPETQRNAGVLSIQAEMQAIDGHTVEAIRLARAAVAAASGSAADLVSCRLSLARVLLQAKGSEDEIVSGRREALALLRELALGNEAPTRESLEILIRLALQPPVAGLVKEAALDPVVSHAASLPALPDHLKVAAWDLKLAGRDAEGRKAAMEEFCQTYRSPDQPSALEAARWLNQHREFDRTLKLADTRMQTDESWFLVGMDALAAKGAWADILDHLSPAQHPPLAPAVAHLFAFRARRQLGQNVDPDTVWRDVQAKLSVESAALQLYVAAYAEQLGYPGEATVIYRRMLTRTGSLEGIRESAPERMKAYLGLLRTASPSMSLDELTEVYAGLVKEFPERDDAQNDLHYLRLLQNKAGPSTVEEVSRLLSRHPELLAVRSTLALALLRQGRTHAADEVYSGWQIDWNTAPDRYKAVRIAVLEAAGHHLMAGQLRSNLVTTHLREEEKRLAADGAEGRDRTGDRRAD